MITRGNTGNALAHFNHNTRAFMAQNSREHAFWIFTRQSKRISMAHAGMSDFHQHFARLGWCNVHLDNLQGLARTKSNGST